MSVAAATTEHVWHTDANLIQAVLCISVSVSVCGSSPAVSILSAAQTLVSRTHQNKSLTHYQSQHSLLYVHNTRVLGSPSSHLYLINEHISRAIWSSRGTKYLAADVEAQQLSNRVTNCQCVACVVIQQFVYVSTEITLHSLVISLRSVIYCTMDLKKCSKTSINIVHVRFSEVTLFACMSI